MIKKLSYLTIISFGALFMYTLFFDKYLQQCTEGNDLAVNTSTALALIFFLSSLSLAIKNLK
jgi:hypothetical protein